MRTLPRRQSKSRNFALALLAAVSLLPAASLLAQEVPGGAALALFVYIFYAIFIVFYIYAAIATQVIARKTGTENGWMAWIPVANLVLWAQIAKKPIWWGLLCLVPFVNFVFMVLLWMAIAEARNKPNWWGIVMIIPLVGLIVPGYLAWSE
ncbi:MAG: DUF5684 domain-containing protein [Terriglobia bacterium]